MRGSLPVDPLRVVLAARLSGEEPITEFVRVWTARFPESSERAIYRFVERVLTRQSDTITRDRADEAALVLGLMPTDLWGEDWWT